MLTGRPRLGGQISVTASAKDDAVVSREIWRHFYLLEIFSEREPGN